MILVAFNNNSIEYVVDQGYNVELIILYRSLVTLSLFVFFGATTKRQFLPSKIKPYIGRVIIYSFSMYLLILSFEYLSAATVSLVQRLDIPILIIISTFFVAPKSTTQFYLSIWVIIVTFFFILSSSIIDEEVIGFFYAIGSVILVSTTYVLIKSQTRLDSQIVIGTMYAFGLVSLSTLLVIGKGIELKMDVSDLWVFIIGGLFNFLIMLSAIQLFKLKSTEKARLPFVLGAVATLIVEMIIEHKFFNSSHIGLILLISGMMVTICINPNIPQPFIKRSIK